MTARDTSLEALQSLDLQAQEEELLRLIRYHFQLGRFTRKELAMRTGWTINRITGRVFSLVSKGALIEHGQTRDGGHLLSIAQSKATAPAVSGTTASAIPGDPPRQPAPPEAVAPIDSFDRKGKPLRYMAEGFGPGWPPDQDRARGRR
jgi:hypothetical protein